MSRPKLLALLCLAMAVAPALAVEPRPLAIAIHGGAGVIDPAKMTPQRAASYRAGLAAALDAGYAILERGGSSLDAVTAAVRTMEDDPQFNAGRGAVLNHEGDAELDAALMDGHGPRAGAVAGVRHVRNPVELARLVMEKSPHVLLVAEGAEEFALEQGVVLVPRGYFRTEARVRELDEARQTIEEAMTRWRGDATRLTERAGTSLQSVFDQLGLVSRDAYEELELRVAQLEHRLRLAESRLESPPARADT